MLDIMLDFSKERDCLLGVCGAEPVEGAAFRVGGRKPPFASRPIDERLDPQLYLKGAKSVLAIGVPFGESLLPASDGGRTGYVCSMASGEDYHGRVKGMLTELRDMLLEKHGFRSIILVDSGALLEKEWAVKAGLGFWGKNCIVVSPGKGSFFNIGLMLLDAAVKNRHAISGGISCGSCRRCIDACPTGALSGDGYILDYSRCLSYLTQKKTLDEEEEEMLGGHLYGCDECQRACPWNKPGSTWVEKAKAAHVSLEWVSRMGEEEFEMTFKRTSAGWRGIETLRRSAWSMLKR
jgi:epoxyqueuosine reductase